MTGQPLRLTAQSRRRFAEALRRTASQMAQVLAACVGVETPSRLETLRREIESYALALVRARLGLLRLDAEASATAAHQIAGAADHPAETVLPLSKGPGGSAARAAIPEDLDRFCKLTGVSPEHVGGQGSNLAGIAFYFRVFTILTSRRQVPLERLERLLSELRRCREQLDGFVLRWTSTQAGLLGYARKAEIQGVIHDLQAALGMPA